MAVSFHPEGCRQTRCPADFQGPALAARRRAPRGRGVLLRRRSTRARRRSSASNMYMHEFVHDARHFLGFPCH